MLYALDSLSLSLSFFFPRSLSLSLSLYHNQVMWCLYMPNTYTRTSRQMVCKFPESERESSELGNYINFIPWAFYISTCICSNDVKLILLNMRINSQVQLHLIFSCVLSHPNHLKRTFSGCHFFRPRCDEFREWLRIKRAHVSTICTYLIERGRTHPAKWCARVCPVSRELKSYSLSVHIITRISLLFITLI